MVLTPQMYLNLNTDTFSLSEQSTSVFVSCPPPAIQLGVAGLKVTSQINKALLGDASGCTDLDSPCGAGRIFQVEMRVEC